MLEVGPELYLLLCPSLLFLCDGIPDPGDNFIVSERGRVMEEAMAASACAVLVMQNRPHKQELPGGREISSVPQGLKSFPKKNESEMVQAQSLSPDGS